MSMKQTMCEFVGLKPCPYYWMKLPVDMDGIPIREGDTVQFVNDAGGTGAAVEVCAVSEHYAYYHEGKHFYRAKNCRHVKQRTVEDVLREMLDRNGDGIGLREFNGNFAAFVKHYADEIRDLTEVDA